MNSWFGVTPPPQPLTSCNVDHQGEPCPWVQTSPPELFSAHEHVWQPVSVTKEPRYGTVGWDEFIYALCQCGTARKFRVEATP